MSIFLHIKSHKPALYCPISRHNQSRKKQKNDLKNFKIYYFVNVNLVNRYL